MYLEFARALTQIKRKAFVVENVSGMVRANFMHLLQSQLKVSLKPATRSRQIKDNPRLPEDLVPRTQEKMVSYIASKGAIEDLMLSIWKNGFFVDEALVAYRNAEDKPGMLRIIEGNRRLTAVKLILESSLYPNRVMSYFQDRHIRYAA